MYICGQKNLLGKIDRLIEAKKYPRFSILVAPEGAGKKLLSEYIANKLGAEFNPCETKAESVREVIYNAYQIESKNLYMFFDCDDMSVTSKNALLKVTEEPPNDAYFIMTVRDLSNVLGTIISRATVFYLDPYSPQDLKNFITEKNYTFNDKDLKIVCQICSTPLEVTLASKINIEEVYSLADKFIQLIGGTSLSNELKISTMLSTKKDDNKIDPVLFMRSIMVCSCDYMKQPCSKEDSKIFNAIIKETSKFLYDLQSKGLSRSIVVDNWILATHLAVCEIGG